MSNNHLTLVKSSVALCFNSVLIESFARALGLAGSPGEREALDQPVLIELGTTDAEWFEAVQALCEGVGRLVIAIDTRWLEEHEASEEHGLDRPMAEIYEMADGFLVDGFVKLYHSRNGKTRLLSMDLHRQYALYADGTGAWVDLPEAFTTDKAGPGVKRAGMAWFDDYMFHRAEAVTEEFPQIDPHAVIHLPGVQLQMGRGGKRRRTASAC